MRVVEAGKLGLQQQGDGGLLIDADHGIFGSSEESEKMETPCRAT